MKFKISTLLLAITLLFCLNIWTGCGKGSASCDDGEQNQGEIGIDCGGPCTACNNLPTCFDGVQNGSEEGVDCGGSCANPCNNNGGGGTASLKATVTVGSNQPENWTATTATATEVTSGTLSITGSSTTYSFALTHSGSFATGSFPLANAVISNAGAGILGCQASGNITFTTFSTTAPKKVSGTFALTCDNGGTPIQVSGTFENLPY